MTCKKGYKFVNKWNMHRTPWINSPEIRVKIRRSDAIVWSATEVRRCIPDQVWAEVRAQPVDGEQQQQQQQQQRSAAGRRRHEDWDGRRSRGPSSKYSCGAWKQFDLHDVDAVRINDPPPWCKLSSMRTLSWLVKPCKGCSLSVIIRVGKEPGDKTTILSKHQHFECDSCAF